MIHYFQDLFFYFTLNLDKLCVHLECVVLQQHWCTMLVFEEILSSGNYRVSHLKMYFLKPLLGPAIMIFSTIES